MIDMEGLSARLGNNATIVEKILDIFVTQYGNKPSVFGDSIASGNTEEIYHLAHSIKGALANMCAEEDAAAAGAIESAARDGNIPEESLVADMEKRIRDINEQIANTKA